MARVDINGAGQFSVFNKNGSVDVVVDIAGYYEDHNHDDRYVQLPTDKLVVNPIGLKPIMGTGWTVTFLPVHLAGLWTASPHRSNSQSVTPTVNGALTSGVARST